MCRLRRAAHAVFGDAAIIVALMPIYECVVDANIRQPADQNQSLGFQTFEQDLKLSSEKTRITAFVDKIVSVAHVHFFGGDRRAGTAFQAMDVFVAVQLAAIVYHVLTVNFLKEDNRNVGLMGRVHHAARTFEVLIVIGHARDAIVIATHEG